MPLNKLDNFIKNTEGRILYVSPADLDSTDSIDNTGNSLARPFKTIQRAILESARFSYVKGNNNDLIERTTILLMPGEHIVDNRPGFYIKDNSGAKVVSRDNTETAAADTLGLGLNSNFDLTQEDNILYKFNSVNGGVIVPRGTSIVGLDLRKTKIRPLYVPNPTDTSLANSAIFRITGTCYFWQFSLFDGNENSTVYTDANDFSTNNKSKPIFSHHKLTCFEYADGVNKVSGYDLTDLDMFYAKLSNAYGTGSGSPNRNIDSKYPAEPDGFAKMRPEWEIVGAFASDPIEITSIISGDGGTPNNQVTVTTSVDHGLSAGTPIKISGVSPVDYNVSTKVQSVDGTDPRKFTYLLPTFRKNLTATGNASSAEVVIETDTVTGASPYIFNVSLRSVLGMNGMHADGSKASGFRSMVVAQFTGISLQKDDRAFAKYNESSRGYNKIALSKVTGANLSNGASSTDPNTIYHLDSNSIYRQGWEQTHIRVTNDAILQIVSVFAIGYNKHFAIESGGDASITNSNSNFGQLSLVADGFRKTSFEKDNKAFITHIIPPRSVVEPTENVDWLSLDVGVTTAVGDNTRLYLRGFESIDDEPPVLTQGYRVGAKVSDKLFVKIGSTTTEANVFMQDGTSSSFKEFNVTAVADSKLTIGLGHGLQTGEKVVILSDDADYPGNIVPHRVYFAISLTDSSDTADFPKIRLAATKTDADNGKSISLYLPGYSGNGLRVRSRITDKSAGEAGSPVQFDTSQSRWYVKVNAANTVYSTIDSLGVAGIGVETNPAFLQRTPDNRSLDEKIYKIRVVIPKEYTNAKTPESAFVIQESSTTGFSTNTDDLKTTIELADFDFNRNPRFISTCSHNAGISSVITELPHNLEVGEEVNILNVTDTNNTVGSATSGYNGTFTVASVSSDNMSFTYSNTTGNPGTFNNNTSTRDLNLPRYQRNNLQSNFYVYRNEVINEYIEDQQDGVYHIYALKADNAISEEFTDLEYGQNVTDLYPQTDRDNVNDNPASTKSKAVSSPIGEVHTSDLKGSITRESADSVMTKLAGGLVVNSVSTLSAGIQTVTFTRNHSFAGISTAALNSAGSGTRTNGVYYNVKLYDNNTYTSWRGATGIVSVTSNAISSFEIQSPGSGYANSNVLFFDNAAMGGNQDGSVIVSTAGISTNIGDIVQFTGIATISDAYYRITDVPQENRISIARTSGDPTIQAGHVVLMPGPSVSVTSSDFFAGISTITTTSSHGLVAGNKFRLTDASANNIGDFFVKSKISETKFTYETTVAPASPGFVLKHYFSSNSGVSDSSQENLARRQQSFYAGDSLVISNGGSDVGVTTTHIPVVHSSGVSGIGITERFPLGTYIQVNDEIMRVADASLVGTNKLVVLRGVFSSPVGIHSDTALVRKIKPLPIEFRRPSILRASGHTFEYLGYGPGNYSTGLPQVQTRTLTEREEFLSQAQERSAGVVVYTGMNNRGDFYIGNTKKSSTTGEETSFDTPIPTVTGEDPARLSAIFDEITVKERIIVEGGDSRQILSQFDGPVTFNNEVRIKEKLSLSKQLVIKDTTAATTSSSGALIVEGGVGIGGDLHIGGELVFPDDKKLNFGDSNDLQISHQADFTSQLDSAGETITDNSASLIKDAGAGPLVFKSNSGSGYGAFQFFDQSWNPMLKIYSNGKVGLYYAGQGEKLRTTFDGVKITGNLNFPDDKKVLLGDNNEMQLVHESSGNSFIGDIGTGYFGLVSAGTGVKIQKHPANVSELSAQFLNDGAVELYYDNSLKFETTELGVRVTGIMSATDDIIAYATSDERLKDNIAPIDDPLAKVISISGNTFDWNENTNNEGSDTGVIAQEIEALGLPGLVTTRDNGYKAVRYEKLVPLLVEAIKELSGKVDALEQKLSDK